jgi:hypothetical protein
MLVVAALLGVGLGGLAVLLCASLRLEGGARLRMDARVLALNTLEQGAPVPDQGPFRLTLGQGTVQVAWTEGNRSRELTLQGWRGHD